MKSNNISRCSWVNLNNPKYIEYHDKHWGVPLHDDHMLFEMLILECFQAGLSWECVLNKKEAFEEAFEGFTPEVVMCFDEEKLNSLASNKNIIRNRLKIKAAVTNASVFIDIQNEFGSFDNYIWRWTEGRIIRECGNTNSVISDAISRDLKKRGMKFVGTTIIYSYLQAIGVIFSHDPSCYLCQIK